MTALPEAVTAALDAAATLVDVDGPSRACAAWGASPWRVAVVGRTSVGKSTLINALIGRRALKTGLGGVSTESVEIDDPAGRTWIDTPGLDGPDRHLAPSLPDEVDAVVWVVDGLQPMTSSERLALDDLPLGFPVHVVVSRADRVEEGELPSVLARVRAVSSRWAPLTVRATDLRAAERQGGHDLADLGTPAPWLSPRRRRALRSALSEVARALDALPPSPDRAAAADALVARWRGVVRGVVEPVEDAIRSGRIGHRAPALRWLRAQAIPAVEAFRAEAAVRLAPLAPAEALSIDPPASDDHGRVDVAGGLGGAGAALREVRAAAARWLGDGEIALREWVAAAIWHGPAPEARAEAVRSVARALAVLGSQDGSPGGSC